MKTLVYLLLMTLTAAISDSPEEEQKKEAPKSRCTEKSVVCTANNNSQCLLQPSSKVSHCIVVKEVS